MIVSSRTCHTSNPTGVIEGILPAMLARDKATQYVSVTGMELKTRLLVSSVSFATSMVI